MAGGKSSMPNSGAASASRCFSASSSGRIGAPGAARRARLAEHRLQSARGHQDEQFRRAVGFVAERVRAADRMFTKLPGTAVTVRPSTSIITSPSMT
jgi:hypothetical protein